MSRVRYIRFKIQGQGLTTKYVEEHASALMQCNAKNSSKVFLCPWVCYDICRIFVRLPQGNIFTLLRHRLVPSTGGDFFVDASLDDRGVRALSECPVTRTILDSRFMGAVWHAEKAVYTEQRDYLSLEMILRNQHVSNTTGTSGVDSIMK
ncbi:4379_t:CDS:2 [Entrophospora sp. SA101]|nr:4379_t:CDS:2 [Entrophospora sp. SA101]